MRRAADRYGIPLADWLNLSTGINPDAWRPPAIPLSAWQRLPEDEDGLEAAARRYYETDRVLPVAGSQAAIQALPSLRGQSSVWVLHPGYAEHAHAWRRAGHAVTPVSADRFDEAADTADVLVLSHPNNPTGERFDSSYLLSLGQRLADRSGWLVVDEAFMDVTPEESLAGAGAEGVIVLRSLGKFFGLAGARVGFVCAGGDLLARLRASLGPWTVSTAARWVATEALCDAGWHARARRKLDDEGRRLRALLAGHGLVPDGGCGLFQWLHTEEAASLHDALARRGILVRLFDDPPSLRFGLPGPEAEWRRLDEALIDVLAEVPSGDREVVS